MFGTRIQALAWGLIFLFQPVSAAFFPVEILPPFLKVVAYALPITYVFEAARKALEDSSVDWQLFLISFVLNVIYFLGSLWIFKKMFERSKETGQFARNEG
jgi:ABC-2 type transport system permease protein